MHVGCPFCDIDPSDVAWAGDGVIAFRDRFPVSPGHTLLIPRRHVATWFDATREEQQALLDAVAAIKEALDRDLDPKPDGYNIGFNSGEAAGQTVMHLHVHVIPRYRGDMDDPRGGVRHVIPSKGNYLRAVKPLATGGLDDPFGRHVSTSRESTAFATSRAPRRDRRATSTRSGPSPRGSERARCCRSAPS